MRASSVMDQVEELLTKQGYIVRWIPQEVSLRVKREIYIEVSSLSLEPSDPTGYEWSLTLTLVLWEQGPKQCLDELQRVMVILDKADYDGILTWQIESASVNAMGTWFEGELVMSYTWLEEVSW